MKLEQLQKKVQEFETMMDNRITTLSEGKGNEVGISNLNSMRELMNDVYKAAEEVNSENSKRVGIIIHFVEGMRLKVLDEDGDIPGEFTDDNLEALNDGYKEMNDEYERIQETYF